MEKATGLSTETRPKTRHISVDLLEFGLHAIREYFSESAAYQHRHRCPPPATEAECIICNELNLD